MRHLTVFAASLAALSSFSTAQDPAALLRLIEGRFATASDADTLAFVQEATRLGIVRNRVEAAQAKEVFRAYVAKESERIDRRLADANKASGGFVGPANGNDVECNDVAGFADTLTVTTGQTCVVNGQVGATGAGDTRDVYRLQLVGGPEHELVISTVPAGTSTAPPATLNLADSGQRFILNGSLVGTTRSINKIKLPDGTYYVTVSSTGTYTLSIASTATTIPTLTNGTTGSFTLAPEVHTYRLVVGGVAEAVNLTVTNQSATDVGDYFFNLGRAKGGRVLFMDDVLVPPATVLQNDPLIDAELPAGTYYLFLQEFTNLTANANYTIRYSSTPITSVPNAIGTNSYTMLHGGNFFLYNLNLATTDHFRLVTSRTVTTGDSILEVLDSEMGQVQFFDDSATGLTTATLHSYGDSTLPAAQYWVLARNFSTTANTNFTTPWTMTGTAGLPVVINALDNVRVGPLSIALGDHYAFTHRACTDTPLTAVHTPGNLALIGSDGLLRGYFRNLSTAGSTTTVGTSLRENELIHGVIASTNYAATTTASVYLAGKLGIDLSPVSGTGVYSLKSEDKIGNLQVLFLSFGSGPALPIPPVSGKLCLDLATLTNVATTAFTTSCRFTWPLPDLRPFIPPQSVPGIRFQAVSVDGAFNLTFTNIAQ